MLAVRRVKRGCWNVQEVHRDLDGRPVWSERRTEPPPSMEGIFTLTEAMRVCLLNLFPGENILAAVSSENVVPVTPFFIQPDDVRVMVGTDLVGPYENAEKLAKAMAGAAYRQLGFLD